MVAAETHMEEIRDTATSEKYLKIAKEAELAGDRLKAIEAYEAAFTADPDSPEVCFRLAYNLDLVGEEEEALHLYEQCVQQERPPLNALINLAVLYEDRGMYVQAERCIRQVLSTNPNHPRARVFIKDIVASREMVIEDHRDLAMDANHAMLDVPVTDFDLSVRTRNSLRKMNIRTLADLLRLTEAELRSYKNFGESSMEEIKAMLAQRGLKLGQLAEEGRSNQAVTSAPDSGAAANNDENDLYNRSVNELQLSVRARKALALLNATSLGDLCSKTEAELMGVKNFGMTSLLEIKEKLAELGLGLRTLND